METDFLYSPAATTVAHSFALAPDLAAAVALRMHPRDLPACARQFGALTHWAQPMRFLVASAWGCTPEAAETGLRTIMDPDKQGMRPWLQLCIQLGDWVRPCGSPAAPFALVQTREGKRVVLQWGESGVVGVVRHVRDARPISGHPLEGRALSRREQPGGKVYLLDDNGASVTVLGMATWSSRASVEPSVERVYTEEPLGA